MVLEKKSSKLISLGSNMIAGMGVMSYFGYRADIYFENRFYYLTAVGLLFGFSWSMYETIKLVKLMEKDDK